MMCPRCRREMDLVYIHRETRESYVELYMYRCRRCGLGIEDKRIYEPAVQVDHVD